jgi:hypothetical protein
MASDIPIRLVLSASDQASKVLEQVGQNTSKLSKATDVLKSAFAGVAASTVIGFLGEAARAAAADEANTVKLRTAIENTGLAFDDVSAAIAARIKAGQELAFSDDQTRDSLGALTQITGDVSRAMELNSLAMDLARAKGMDLTTASELIGKVSAGNTGILGRYGVVLGENATATEALAALQQKFGGQAEKYGTTTQASIDKVKDSVDEWVESIGASFGPAQGLIALLPGLQSGMTLAGAAVGALLPRLGALKVTLLTSVIPAIGATILALGPILIPIAAIGLAILALKIAWESNFLGIRDVVAEIAPKVVAFVDSITAPIRTLIDLVQRALEWLGQLTSFRVSLPTFTLPGFSAPAAAAATVTTAEQISRLRRGVPIFQEGGVMPHTGLALLHGGERVLTRDQQRSWGGWSGDVVINGDVVGLSKTDLAQELWRIATQQRRMQGLA